MFQEKHTATFFENTRYRGYPQTLHLAYLTRQVCLKLGTLEQTTKLDRSP